MNKPTRWDRVVPQMMFANGCLAALAGLWLYVEGPHLLALSSHQAILWFGVVALTLANIRASRPFHPRRSPWVPVIRPTESAVRIGRVVLVAALCDLVYRSARLYWSSPSEIEEDMIQLLSAFLVTSGCLSAACWALQPENLFSPKVLEAIRWDPIDAWIIRPLLERGRAKHHSVPLDEWLAGVLRCCETAAEGGRLVNSETSVVGEVDCVEFQALLLDELESRAGVVRHRPQLSNDGFREIRRFIRSVEALSHREPDQEKWQQAVRDARSVLAIRDKLTVGR